jgi:hypothetical protein
MRDNLINNPIDALMVPMVSTIRSPSFSNRVYSNLIIIQEQDISVVLDNDSMDAYL